MSTGLTDKKKEFEPKLLVPQDIKTKIDRLVRNCPVEVAFFGFVTFHEINEIKRWPRLYDIAVPMQVVSAHETDWDLAAFMEEEVETAEREGREPRIGDLNLFGHSHGSTSAFSSTEDYAQIERLAEHGGVPWFFSWIQDHKGKVELRYDQFKPFRIHVPSVTPVAMIPSDLEKWAREQLEERVTIVESTSSTTMVVRGDDKKKTEEEHPVREELRDQKITPRDGRWPGAVSDWVRLIGNTRVREVDMCIVETQDISTGEVLVFEHPTLKEFPDNELEGEDKLNQSRSISRSTEKKVKGGDEGKVGAPQDGASQESKPQTPAQSEAKSDSQRSKQERPERQKVDDVELVLESDIVTDRKKFVGEVDEGEPAPDPDEEIMHYLGWFR